MKIRLAIALLLTTSVAQAAQLALSDKGTIKVAEITKGGIGEKRPIAEGFAPVWAPGGKELAFANSRLKIYNFTTGKIREPKTNAQGMPTAWSSRGHIVVTGISSHWVITEKGRPWGFLPGSYDVVITPEGNIGLKEMLGPSFSVFTENGVRALTIPGHNIAFSPKKEMLCYVSRAKPQKGEPPRVVIINTRKGEKIQSFLLHEMSMAPQWTEDGTHVVFGDRETLIIQKIGEKNRREFSGLTAEELKTAKITGRL